MLCTSDPQWGHIGLKGSLSTQTDYPAIYDEKEKLEE